MLSEHHKSVSENRQLTADYLLNKTQAMQYKLKYEAHIISLYVLILLYLSQDSQASDNGGYLYQG